MARMNQRHRRENRRLEAEQRNAAWASLSPQEQLKCLDERNLVATKQRNKIKEKDERHKNRQKPSKSN